MNVVILIFIYFIVWSSIHCPLSTIRLFNIPQLDVTIKLTKMTLANHNANFILLFDSRFYGYRLEFICGHHTGETDNLFLLVYLLAVTLAV